MVAWLHGCSRFTVQPLVKKDGTLPETAMFDEPQLEIISKKKGEKPTKQTGGYDFSIKPKNQFNR